MCLVLDFVVCLVIKVFKKLCVLKILLVMILILVILLLFIEIKI